jgi:hypothetical protein
MDAQMKKRWWLKRTDSKVIIKIFEKKIQYSIPISSTLSCLFVVHYPFWRDRHALFMNGISRKVCLMSEFDHVTCNIELGLKEDVPCRSSNIWNRWQLIFSKAYKAHPTIRVVAYMVREEKVGATSLSLCQIRDIHLYIVSSLAPGMGAWQLSEWYKSVFICDPVRGQTNNMSTESQLVT